MKTVDLFRARVLMTFSEVTRAHVSSYILAILDRLANLNNLNGLSRPRESISQDYWGNIKENWGSGGRKSPSFRPPAVSRSRAPVRGLGNDDLGVGVVEFPRVNNPGM